jgi:hypothetical protein
MADLNKSLEIQEWLFRESDKRIEDYLMVHQDKGSCIIA